MVGIVTVCAAFGLTVSEARAKVMCLRTRLMPDAAVIFSIEVAGQCTSKCTSSYTSRATSTTIPTCP